MKPLSESPLSRCASTSTGAIAIGDSNPLFEDENVDGVPDSLAEALGVTDRNDIVPGTGRTLLDHYMGTNL